MNSTTSQAHAYRAVIDDVVPVKTKLVSSKPAPPFYSHSVHLARCERRKLERVWRKSKSEEDRRKFLEKADEVKNKLYEAKEQFYINEVQEKRGNQKELYGVVNNLLNRKKER
jgi:hypothetical protein